MDRNQALQEYTGWLYTVARHMTTGPMVDDLVQEGYIAMWRALGTYDPDKGSYDWWLKHAATNRMRTVVSGGSQTTVLEKKNTTGFTQTRGNDTRKRIAKYLAQHPDATGAEIARVLDMSQAAVSYQRKKMGTVAVAESISSVTVSVDAMTEAGWDLEGPDHLDGIAIAYHEGEILAALCVLTESQRKYVLARFWGQKTPAELKALFGYDPKGLWDAAKPRLEKQLAYLRELANA